MACVVDIRHVSKYFAKVAANKDVSLTVDAGQVVALLGENGAGKSTIMKILYGLYAKDEGEILTAGVLIVDIRHKPTADDVTMHDWFRQTGCPEIIVANKLDKLKKSQVEPALALIRETLELTEEDALVPFSAEKGEGKDTLIRLLTEKCGE